MIGSPILNPPSAWSRYSTRLELWHGCLEADAINIHANGVIPALGRASTDFGRGFYTTTIRRQAEEFARRRYLEEWTNSVVHGTPPPSPPQVVSFSVALADIAPLHTLTFVCGDHDQDRFWSFVHHCRLSGADHSYLRPALSASGDGWYDLVSGPVAAFWQQRVAMLGADQLSFHTPTAAQVLNATIGTADFRVFPQPTPALPGSPP